MKKEVYLILHNIRSAHNVGSLFRTSDALGISKIYLTGYTPTPFDRFGNKRKDVAKVSLGAEDTVSWEYFKTPANLISRLKREGVEIIAIEQSEKSIDYKTVTPHYPCAFILGNEVKGISSALLSRSDIVAEIPMNGKKESLNVSVSGAVALYRILNI